MGMLPQQPLVAGVGQAAELDQGGGHVGRGQHDKSGRAVRGVEQRHRAAEFLDNHPGENQRPIVGLAARQIEEDRADLARLARQASDSGRRSEYETEALRWRQIAEQIEANERNRFGSDPP